MSTSPGHSQTLGQSGWRSSADQNGNPGNIDSIPFVGDPTGDANQDGVPNWVHHAVTGTDRAFIAPQIDLSRSGVVVRVTRNHAADDAALTPEWCDDLIGWPNTGVPISVLPSGDRLAEWTLSWPDQAEPVFIRLNASR